MNVSFQELCLLHLRDRGVTPPFRPLVDLLNDRSHQVSWSTLQRILHQEMLELESLKTLDRQERLSADKLEFGQAAIPFLAEARVRLNASDDHVYGNIYELIWVNAFQQDNTIQTRSLYRGQWDSRWRQVTSLLRDPLDVQTLVDRLRATQLFVAELRARHQTFFAAAPTDDELLAVAQHYGFATPLLDYTSSLRVAAWFATSEAKKLTSPHSVIGVIYQMKYLPESDQRQTITDNPGIAGFTLLEAAGVHVGHARYVKPRLADHDNRIDRQKGLFVTGFQPRDLHGATLGALYFWQEPGVIFEDRAENVTAGYLLPDESPVAVLEKEVRERLAAERVPPLPAGLGTTLLPAAGIFGSKGFALQAAITDSRVFFGVLEQHISRLAEADYLRSTLQSLFTEYFQLSRIRADLGGVTPGEHLTLDPYRRALWQLAYLCSTDAERLEAATLEAVPEPACRFRAWPKHAAPLRPANDGERIALACSIYLASWELLQYVDGGAAREVAINAYGMLGVVDDLLGFTFKRK